MNFRNPSMPDKEPRPLPAIRYCSAPIDVVRQRAESLLRFHDHISQSGPERFWWPLPTHGSHVDILTEPDVFCPNVGEGSQLLASCLGIRPPVSKMLDMGTGTGIHGIIAAKQGAQVVAIDVGIAACHCAAENAKRNDVSERISIRKGDLFEPLLASEQFDLVSFNAPFMDGVPTSPVEKAMFDPEHGNLSRFVAGVGRHLKPEGVVLIAFSTAGDMEKFKKVTINAGYSSHVVAVVSVWHIEYVVFELCRKTKKLDYK